LLNPSVKPNYAILDYHDDNKPMFAGTKQATNPSFSLFLCKYLIVFLFLEPSSIATIFHSITEKSLKVTNFISIIIERLIRLIYILIIDF